MKTLLLSIILTLHAHACLWLDGTTIDGKEGRVETDHTANLLRKSRDMGTEDRFDTLMRNRSNASHDASTTRETEGVEKVFDGKYGDALSIFNEIESKHPGRYSTAVNMGTAYELQGDLEQALKWITEGIRRNSESHFGTEWLHVEILKTRIKLREDPGYLQQNHIIEPPNTVSRSSLIQIGGRSYGMNEIADAIFYQLRERMIFVKPPDPVVADLLFTLGEIEGRIKIVESAIKSFELANEYGFPHRDVITGKIERHEQMLHDREEMLRYRKIGLISGAVLAIAAFILFLISAWRNKWFFLSRAAYLKHRREKALHP